jgi:ribosomal protein S18 acetylase RimI-like enzyme
VNAQRLLWNEAVPEWITLLEAAVFDIAWRALASYEQLWVIDTSAFARWSVIPATQEAELLRIAVRPGERREGLGRALLDACELQFKREGIHTLLLEVRLSNIAAQRLYEDAGWVQNGHRPRYYSDGEDALLYRKELIA